MDKEKIENVLECAVSNVACEIDEKMSQETLENMKKQLLGISKRSDKSFIYSLYEEAINEEKEKEEEVKKYGRK